MTGNRLALIGCVSVCALTLIAWSDKKPPSEALSDAYGTAVMADTAHIVWRDDGFVSLAADQSSTEPDEQAVISVTPASSRGERPTADGPLRHAGVALGSDAHVSIAPPYVILTRGEESVMLRRHDDERVRVDGDLPHWVEHTFSGGFVAVLNDSHEVTVNGQSVVVRDARQPDHTI